jgi:pimeloyl-ACP methyl ester carboxylesterase
MTAQPTSKSSRRTAPARVAPLALWLLLAAAAVGCAQSKWVRLREVPENPLAGPLKLLSPSGPQPTARTMLLVRRYNLENDLHHHPADLLVKLHEINKQEPSADKLYSLSELAYLAGKRAEPMSRQRALELHALAMVNGYNYLFDERFGRFRNPYDPEFRGACDLYNGALESSLRIINKKGGIVPGSTHEITMANQTIEATVVLRGNGWRAEDFSGFHFVSDYEVRGLQNHYHNYGLGVPLIAVRKHHALPSPEEKFYPPGMSLPVTAFLRVHPGKTSDTAQHVAHLELHDPLNTSAIHVGGREVPLESDLTTPLAYALNQKQLQDLDSSTVGLLNPAKTEKLQGLYMLEPYQPGKIPVIMIHGIWSSPITWMEMFNDLRGAPEIRSRYQFWFYLYPSGQPFWYSAADLRRDLAETRKILDPSHQQPALDQMVLVGHSMGGLVARLQTLDSHNDFWGIVSDRPFQTVKASLDTQQDLSNAFFFRPNPSVRRVITIGTPYRGSEFANPTTRWIGSKIIKLPQMLLDDRQQLRKNNPDVFKSPNLIDVDTSIDSLVPDSPFLKVMLSAQSGPWVKYHTIVGVIPEKGLLGRVVGEGDGVVSFTSAHLENVDSEIVVNADHTTIHSHPLSVLEVHRILLAHLAEVDRPQSPTWQRMPMTASTAGAWGPQRPPAAGAVPLPSLTSPQNLAPPPNAVPQYPPPNAGQLPPDYGPAQGYSPELAPPVTMTPAGGYPPPMYDSAPQANGAAPPANYATAPAYVAPPGPPLPPAAEMAPAVP